MPHLEDDSFTQMFKNDDYFKRFLEGSLQGTQQVLSQTMTVSAQLHKLTEGIALVDAEIQRLILGKHEDLLSQATWIEKLEGVLDTMSSHIQSLLAGVERVRTRITEPYLKIESQIHVLRRVWETIDLLRHTSRIQIVSKRLKNSMQNDVDDLLKLSETIYELTELWDEMDLTAIEVLGVELQSLKSARRDVGKRAKKMLVTGLQTQKPNMVSQAVEVLHNLNSLVAVVAEITKSSKESLEQMMRDSLDPKMLTEEKTQPKGPNRPPTSTSSTLFRPRLWSTLEKLFDAIFEQSVQIEALEIALRKPRADVIGTKTELFIDDFPDEKQIVANLFWTQVTNSLSGFLVKYAGDSVLFKQALEGEYPRFLRLYIDLCKRLQSTDKPDSFATPFEMNKKVISNFEKSYLSKSVSMVLDPVHNMFSKKGAPETEEVDLLIRTVRSELIVALFDPNLSSTIARNITKAVRLFCSNCENIVDRSPEATQVIGPRKRVQDENIAVANITEYLKTMLQNVMSNLNTDSDATMIVSLSLVDADNLIASIINPVLTAVENAILAILLTMHKEDFSKDTVSSKVSTSLYMRELQEFITRAYGTYLQPFESEDIIRRCCSATGQRCVQLFMRHVSILRPLGAHGRAKLVADCNQLEAAVAPLLGDDPKTYRILRSFRSLLSQSPQEILKNPVIGEIIPCSLVLFYLFSFGPDEMKSPHQSGVNWSPEELSSWMNSHESERDRLALVSGALGRYCNLVRQQTGKNFDPVYGVMAELIQRTSER